MIIHIIIFLAVLLVLYLLAIMPRLRKRPEIEELKKWNYAHRGLHGNDDGVPENSLKAFKEAVSHGYGIELDVQITKDGIPVVFHDYDLKRACGEDRKVADLTYEELEKYRLFQSDEKIPLLKEVLALVDGKIPLIVEFKIPFSPGPTCIAAMEYLREYKGRYCVESFNPLCLIWFRKYYPAIIRGQLSTDFQKEELKGSKAQYFILKHLLFNFLTKPDFIAFQHIYKACISFRICRKLYRVPTFAWTVRSAEEYEAGKGMFDRIIFEHFLVENK